MISLNAEGIIHHFNLSSNLTFNCLGINLQIRNLDIDDAGNYICEVENEAEPIQQTNTLQILGKPSEVVIQQEHSKLSIMSLEDFNYKIWSTSQQF